MTNYKGTIEQHISDLKLAIANAEDEAHKAYWQREKEFLEELQWYRSQNLIQKSFAIEEVKTQGMPSATLKVVLVERIARIPKAEPPHATVDETNRDCETCKHY